MATSMPRQDIKRKKPWYLSDFKDVLHVQSLASFLFLYFACLTPIITFGGLLAAATNNDLYNLYNLLGRYNLLRSVFWAATDHPGIHWPRTCVLDHPGRLLHSFWALKLNCPSQECFVVDYVFFLSCILFIGTCLLAYGLKSMRNGRFLPTKHAFELSSCETGRGWFIQPFHEKNPKWLCVAAIIPALLATILLFMDQQITAVIIIRRKNKLKKWRDEILKGNFGWARRWWSPWVCYMDMGDVQYLFKCAPGLVMGSCIVEIDRIVIREVQYQLEVNWCRNIEVNFQGSSDNSDRQTDGGDNHNTPTLLKAWV
ncbi:hypothetical protein DPMN_067718 [Dreissena polymorpha]|uniref:Bicarbonate transporter-like transmembrane domain-containing protein n=1 Tax=Dreissena polymorpha TaxID=45954 RepID=A0A9D4BLK2_DREPO|nr:hypothetical protein DPMN_067718 [Dreissena polymorpha]